MIDTLLDVAVLLLFAGFVGSCAVIVSDFWRSVMDEYQRVFVDVREQDLRDAADVWSSYHHYDSLAKAYLGFCEYLGGAKLPKVLGWNGVWPITPQQEHRMRLLLGPHARTVIKAYYARKQDDDIPSGR